MTADSPEFEGINEVHARHCEHLMDIPGVVGVAIGLAEDGKTPCLQVLVTELTPELEERIPAELDGHPVTLVASGVIRPLDGQ